MDLQGCGCRRRDELGGNGAFVVTAVDFEHIFRQTQETQMIHIYYITILLYIKMMNYYMNQIPILLNDVFLFENAELPIGNDSFALGYVTLPEGITRSWGSPSPFESF